MNFHQVILSIAVVWYSLTAYYSIGYFQSDEHYQIIEFAEHIKGTNTDQDLAWEFPVKIRPITQPAICYLIFELCDIVSITNPYNKAFVLRLITGLLSVLIIFFFTTSCKGLVSSKNWKLFLILSYFIWFLPFINVRFASETWSGIALLAAVSILLRNKRNFISFLFVGVLLGASFLFRYQIGFAILGLLLWLLLIRKETVSRITLILASGSVIVLFGIFLDSWFYGEPVLTSWNYLRVNIYEGKAPEFGTRPWYYYFYLILRYSFYPIGIVILISALTLIYKKPKSIFIWILLPFFIVHVLIPHKEFRFLFPLINYLPIIFILAIQEINWKALSRRKQGVIRVLAALIITANLSAVVIASLKPAGDGKMRLTKKIREIAPEESKRLYYTYHNDPYTPWAVTANFYVQNNLITERLNFPLTENFDEINEPYIDLLIITAADLQNTEIQNFIAKKKMVEVTKSVPDVMLPFLSVYGYPNTEILILYSVR